MAAEKPDGVDPTAEDDPFAGTVYRAIGRLGGGGMGDVFIVEHQEIGRRFAAKLLRAQLSPSRQLVDRLRLEAHALGRLSHPNVVSVVDFAKTGDGRPFLVMELLRGQTVAQELSQRGVLPVNVAVKYAMDLLAALEATHGVGLVHRDVKPSNIFLALGPDGSVVLKLLDFGITRVLPDAPLTAPLPLVVPTATGEVLGTPRYTSPEGAAGSRVDARADLYGAALVLYAMLAGRGPFDHVHGPGPLRSAHVSDKPEPPSRFSQEPIPAELDALVLHALEKDPNARFSTAREFRTRLAEVGDLLARPSGWLETTAFSREGAKDDVVQRVATPGTAEPPRPAKSGAPPWVLFAVGLVIAALAVAAVGGVLGALR